MIFDLKFEDSVTLGPEVKCSWGKGRLVKGLGKLRFFRVSKQNPFRRMVWECGDSLVAISQPITKDPGLGTCWRWLRYLGHEGD